MTNSGKSRSDDQRRFKRISSIKSGLVLFEDESAPIPVKLIDMSAAGARLELARHLTAPPQFQLVVRPDEIGDRKAVNCKLRWQDGCQVGVSFY
ncbi:PilZ domain-containing protein [Henriciella litoralis]|uniref:PilZ domain-containing protein n=1 Tax=Henriciella litoralis TaxID=568102 RepID=UPI0009FF0390